MTCQQEFVRAAANLILNELGPRLKRRKIGIDASPLSPSQIAVLAACKACGVLDTHAIRKVMDDAFR